MSWVQGIAYAALATVLLGGGVALVVWQYNRLQERKSLAGHEEQRLAAREQAVREDEARLRRLSKEAEGREKELREAERRRQAQGNPQPPAPVVPVFVNPADAVAAPVIPAVPLPPAQEQADETRAMQREEARQAVLDWEEEVRNLNNKVLAARGALFAAKLVYDAAVPGSNDQRLAEAAYILWQRALAEVQADLGRAQFELQSARNHYAQFRD
jgi:hypothetical protein